MASEKSKDDDWSKLSSCDKVRYMFKNITVEPMIFFHIVPAVFAGLTTQNLNLEKACRVNLNFSDEACTALRLRQTQNFTSEEHQVQQLIASMTIWSGFLRSSFPAMLILFVGAWSDRKKKRKPFMLIPVCGELISALGLLVCVYFFYELPLEVAIFVESFFPAITGGWPTFLMAVFSYIGDITTIDMRTVRIGFLSMFASTAMPLGMALSGYALNVIGFYGVYLVSATMNSISFLYGLFRIKEGAVGQPDPIKINVDKKKNGEVKDLQKCDTPNDKQHWKLTQFAKDFFDLSHVKETFSVVFRNSANNRRMKVLLLVLVHTVVVGSMHGEMTIMYLYMRNRFNWNEIKFSMFATYNALIHITGNSVAVILLSHVLKLDDALIGIVSCISKILSDCVLAFAVEEYQVYIASLLGMVNASSIAMRSIASKLVPSEELGKLNSVYEVFAAVTPFLYVPLYGFVYKCTLSFFPGAFLLVGSALLLPAVAIFGWMYIQHVEDRLAQNTHGSKLSSPEKFVSLNTEDVMGLKNQNKLGQSNQAFEADKDP